MARVEAMVLPRLVRHIDPVTREGAPAGYSYAKDQLARALNRVAPERAKEKRAQAMAKRGVKIRILEEEGLAQICLWTTKVQGISFHERINEMAEASIAAERKAVEDAALAALPAALDHWWDSSLLSLVASALAAKTDLKTADKPDTDQTPRR